MKKIGTMTFHHSYNYGSVLQAYALQNKLIEMYPDSRIEIVDYYPPNIREIQSLFVKNHSIRNVLRNIIALKYYPLVTKRKDSFEEFLKKDLRISDKKYYEGNIAEMGDEYDILIAGSDQIWNTNTKDFSVDYFFYGVKKSVKIAYAPSVGNGTFMLPRDQKVQDALSDFQAVSVREYSGAKKIEKFMGMKKVPVLIDPFLLLKKEQYEKICAKRKIDEEYIFFYSITMRPEVLHCAKEIAKKLKLKLITMYSGVGTLRAFRNGVSVASEVAPGDFLSYIKNASLVLTDSFHGTAFSVIYNKEFYSFCSEDLDKRDVRINTLLSALGLENRIVNTTNGPDIITRDGLNYGQSNMKLEKMIKEAEAYLRNNIDQKEV